MKGTRLLVPGSEQAIMEELAASEKDRAENTMIVDLLRNDLSRVCRPGSVQVPALCTVERYRSVAQLTSTVTGELAAGRDIWDLLAAAFPPGSMTGAPKLEACAMLRELEQGPRGLYGGTIGWVEPNGNAELSVVIRTMQSRNGRARWDVGGGIVYDSDPASEWEEAWAKVAVLGQRP
jgi:anthranilate/para-aminobenzoate synthase component I